MSLIDSSDDAQTPLLQEETLEVALAERDRQRRRRLVLEGPEGRLILNAEQPEVVLGRGEHCGITLTAACTSREHARIRRSDSGLYYLEDCSTNGTVVLGQGTGAGLLRRGQRMPLTGAGYIGLGAVPHPGSAWTLRYRLD